MAKMHPSILTEPYLKHCSPAEKRVYEKARDELGPEYYVFYHLEWHEPKLSKPHGESDFVIVHPEYGYICLEVKGGVCAYDSSLGIWSTKDGKNIVRCPVDPFRQALEASKSILNLMPEKKNIYIPNSYAVIFPDCKFDGSKLGSHLKASIKEWQIMDQGGLCDFKKTICHLFANEFEARIPNSQGVQIIRRLTRLHGGSSFEGRVSIEPLLAEIDRKIIDLTNEQIKVLKLLRKRKRCLILGCAGSGKTLLALHKAKELSHEGKKVLFLCFNIPLGAYLQSQCNDFPEITSGPFLELAIEWLINAGVDVEREESDNFYKELLPELIFEYFDSIPHDFDAIIVDEGQDFTKKHWAVLELLMRDSKTGHLYIFADSNQNIFSGSDDYPIKDEPYYLDKNIRNTNQIFRAVSSCCELDPEIEPSGLDGPQVRLQTYTDQSDMLKKIESVLGELISKHVSISDIVLLGTKSQENSCLKYGLKIGPFKLVEKHTSKNQLITMSIRRFKGLESKIVILCELDEKVVRPIETLYVGMTRAKCILILLVEQSFKGELENIGLRIKE